MPDVFLLLVAILALASLVVGIVTLIQLRRGHDLTSLESELRVLGEDLARARDDLVRLEQAAKSDAASQRQELGGHLASQRAELKDHVAALREELSKRLDAASTAQQSLASSMQTSLRDQLAATRTEITAAVVALSKENATNLSGIAERVSGQLTNQSKDANESLERMRSTVEVKLASIQTSANEQLEKMRATVDEKLSATLSTRLGESFKLVSERLEAVQNGFGEMKVLAGNVTDLRKLMTNVKTRGVWGEVQLGNLLEQLFTDEQYERNFRPRARSAESVEFALKLPGPDADAGPVYLPIDSKFPVEDFQRLVEATEKGDVDAARESVRALEARIYGCARDIRDKYINVPTTTNFAVLFLPTEALYAEVTKMPGLIEELTREYRVVVQGPTTFTAFSMALLAGFRTLAIQKRSADIAKLLGAVKTDFGKFADLLAKVEEKLDDAKGTIGKARHRSAQIARKLEKVEELPADEVKLLLPEPGVADLDTRE